MRQLAIVLVALLCTLMAPAQAAETGREYIILTGGVSLWAWEKFKAQPHDNWWMNFVRASRLRMEELQKEDPNVQITWLVFKPAYVARARQDKNDLIGHIQSVRDAYHVKLVFFDKTQEVIDYINAGQPRDQVKISGFEYFGHSNKACWMFDYSSNIDSASKAYLHENDLVKLDRNAFAKDAFAKSWSCHTGESMSAKFKSATGIKMIGAIGKTQYMTDELPILSSPGGRWTR